MLDLQLKVSPVLWVKRLLLVAGALFIAGLAGLATVIILRLLSRFSLAADSHEKHGISHQTSSRLGGVGIAVCALGVYFTASSIPGIASQLHPDVLFAPLAFALVAGAIGLAEDLYSNIRPIVRLILLSLVLLLCFWLNPQLLPAQVGIPGLDSLLALPWLALPLVVFLGVTAINAMNIADGANGLMPVVFTGTFFAFMAVTGRVEYYALFLALLVFALYNLLSGRLFLGDAGSYGLGAAVVIGALELLAFGLASVFWVMALLAYPITEMSVSAIRRVAQGQHPMQADNEHFHNLLFRHLKRRGMPSLAANSLTGLTISLCTIFATLILTLYWPATSYSWLWLLCTEVILYLIIYRQLKKYD